MSPIKQKIQLQKTECWNNAFKWCPEESKKKALPKINDSDYSKMIFTDECLSKMENKEGENGVPIKKAIKSHRWSQNER